MNRVTDLTTAVDGLAAVDLAGVTDNDLHDELVALARVSTRLRHEVLRRTAVYDTRRAYRSDGTRSAAARLARDCGTSTQTARRQVKLGRRIRVMPHAAAALADGVIGEDQFEVLARLAGSPRPTVTAAFADAEETLVGWATELAFREFECRVRYWEQVVDEDGAEDQAADDHAARRLHVSEMLNGVRRIDGEVPLT